jgi:lipoate-protein ligase A
MTMWRLLDTGANFGAYNMALDEEMLARAQKGDTMPLLRFYSWDPPAVSLGRFQKIETTVNTEACKKRGIDIIRRISGGRAVLHDKELTYSLVARTDNPLFPSDVLGTYKVIAPCLVAGLRNLGIHAEIIPRAGKYPELHKPQPKDPACFSSPSWYEIVVRGKKIIGSAQRRLSNAFLQHGSILMDFDPTVEAEVLPGSHAYDGVTSLRRELGHPVLHKDAADAFTKGFAETLRITLTA